MVCFKDCNKMESITAITSASTSNVTVSNRTFIHESSNETIEANTTVPNFNFTSIYELNDTTLDYNSTYGFDLDLQNNTYNADDNSTSIDQDATWWPSGNTSLWHGITSTVFGQFPTTLPPSSPEINQTNQPLSLQGKELGSLIARVVFLGVFILIGFVGNILLFAALSQSERRKVSAFNLFIISIGTANLLDCVGNLPLVLGATITEKWDYGMFVCQFYTFSLQLTSITVLVGICALFFDRCIALKNPVKYQFILTLPKINLIIIYSWLHGAALSFAPLAGLIQVDTMQTGYLCSLKNNSPLAYVCIVPFLGYIIPLFIILILGCIIVQTTTKHKKGQITKKPGRKKPDKMVFDQIVLKDIKYSKYTGVLFLFWVILELPYLILNSAEQITNSLGISNPIISNTSSLAGAQESSSRSSLNYPLKLEIVFIWMRLSFPIILPLLTFVWRKEVWIKFKKTICCKKDNSSELDSTDGTPEKRHSLTRNQGLDSISKKEKRNLPFNIPVLFATDKGIHVQTLSKKPKTPRSPLHSDKFDSQPFSGVEDEDEKDEETNDEDGVDGEIVTARKCDVNGSQDLLQIDEDTSDYDSHAEIDSLAASHNSYFRNKHRANKVAVDRYNSEILLLANSKRSFDNHAFSDVNEGPDGKISKDNTDNDTHQKTNDKLRNNKLREKSSNLNGSTDDLTKQDIRKMKHVRNSNDSGRGSEEGTLIRKENDKMRLSNDINNTPEETRNSRVVVIPEALLEETEKQKRRKRRRRKQLENSNTNTDGALNNLLQDQGSLRPPVRLKPLEATLDSSNSQLPPSPASLHRKLPKPLAHSKFAAPQPPMETNEVQGKESDGFHYHNRTDSVVSAIPEVESRSIKSANLAARRRRTNTLSKTATFPDRLAESDTVQQQMGTRERNASSGSETGSGGQRLAHSDSAADLRRLGITQPIDVKKSQRMPSPRPRKPRKISDMPKTQSEGDQDYW